MGAMTGAEAGLSANQQLRIALEAMVAHGGVGLMPDIYAAIEGAMEPHTLSQQGRATLRSYINRDAVKAGLVLAYDKGKPGWHITAEGQEFLKADVAEGEGQEEVTDAGGAEIAVPTMHAAALGFEKYILSMMKGVYPEHAWYHQGVHKQQERGLDLLGTRLRPEPGQPRVVGVQVKLHAQDNAPSEKEWLKFLAGCFARRVDLGIFVTTGRLTGGQRREAAEAQVVVIEGNEEVSRLAKQVSLSPFNEPNNHPDADDSATH